MHLLDAVFLFTHRRRVRALCRVVQKQLGKGGLHGAGISWLALLPSAARARATAELQVGDTPRGNYMCRIGRPVTLRFGVA